MGNFNYKKNRKATLLVSDVVFLVLVLAFIAILFLFVSKQSSNVYLLEQKTAKEIALLIDASEPGTQVKLRLTEVLDKKETTISDGDAIVIDDKANFVSVKLSGKSGYSYGFFVKRDRIEYSIVEGYLTITLI